MNRVEIMGGLVRPPDLRFTTGGMGIAEVTIAVNGARYDSEKREQVVTTQYIAVVGYGIVSEILAEYDKGDELHIVGMLDQRTIEKDDGKKESKTRVTALVVNCVRQRSGQPRQQREPEPFGDGEPI